MPDPTPGILPHVRHGMGAVRPYLYGPLDLPEFVIQVFGAVELERHAFDARHAHVEMRLSDSVLVIEAGDRMAGGHAPKGQTYVYVQDVDAAYARALQLGATSIAAPADKPYQERQCGFIDAGGNTWWVGSFKA